MSARNEVKIYSCTDQVEIQRLGGICVRRPFSCFLREVLSAYYPDPEEIRIIDLTYGKGTFYAAFRPRELWGIDIYRDEWEVPPDRFILGDLSKAYRRAPHSYFDVAVFDPPYAVEPISRVRKARRHYVRSSWQDLRELIHAARDASCKLLKPGGLLLIKIMDPHVRGYIDHEQGIAGAIYIITSSPTCRLRLTDLLVYRFRHKGRSKVNSRIEKNHIYLAVFRLAQT